MQVSSSSVRMSLVCKIPKHVPWKGGEGGVAHQAPGRPGRRAAWPRQPCAPRALPSQCWAPDARHPPSRSPASDCTRPASSIRSLSFQVITFLQDRCHLEQDLLCSSHTNLDAFAHRRASLMLALSLRSSKCTHSNAPHSKDTARSQLVSGGGRGGGGIPAGKAGMLQGLDD